LLALFELFGLQDLLKFSTFTLLRRRYFKTLPSCTLIHTSKEQMTLAGVAVGLRRTNCKRACGSDRLL